MWKVVGLFYENKYIYVSCYISATKIEFYVGDVPDGQPVTLDNARYTRLG